VGKLVIQREIEQDGFGSIDGNHLPAMAIGYALGVSSAIFHNSFECSLCALSPSDTSIPWSSEIVSSPLVK
jgi:hypothetical protein